MSQVDLDTAVLPPGLNTIHAIQAGVLHAVVQNGDTDPTHFDATPTP